MRLNRSTYGALCLLLSVAAACGDNLGAPDAREGVDSRRPVDARIPTTPTVVSTTPIAAALDVPRNTNIAVQFSEAMDPATLTTTSFTLTTGTPAVAIAGTVVPSGTNAVFWPSLQLTAGLVYTATVTTAAKSAEQVALAAPHSWSFTTGATLAPGMPVNLGTAGGFAILAKSGITTVVTSAVTGDLGVSPIAGTALVGFSQTADATNVFSTSPQVTGRLFAADYAPPTPANLTTAVSNMETAFVDAAARAPDMLNLGAGTIGTITLAPGVYRWGTGLLIPTSITLSGSATSVWIFQVAGDLTVAPAVNVTLAGGALAKNIFWQVSGQVTAGTTSHLEGVILSQTSIILDTGASINGRLLAQTAVTIRMSTVVQPAL